MEGTDTGSDGITDLLDSTYGGISEPETPAIADEVTPPSETPELPAGTEESERVPEPGTDAEPVPETDPLAEILSGGKAASYQVDGKEQTYDKIRVLDGDVGLIDAKDLPDVLRRIGQAEHLTTANQQLYQTTQQYERLAQWTRTKEDGTSEVLTGIPALAEERLHNAQLAVEHEAMFNLLKDPAALHALLLDDGTGKPVYNQERLDAFVLRSQLASGKAQDKVRQEFGSRLQAPQTTPTLNAVEHAPNIIRGAAGADEALLSSDQKALLTQHLQRYIRDVKPGEQGLHGKIVDESFRDLVQSFIAQAKASKASASSASSAAASNAPKIAAALRGVQPPRTPAAKPAPKVAQRQQDADDAWDQREKAAARALHRS